jgi:hypothetical protein
MEEAFQAWRADHGNAFAWAWSYASNYDPDADAGGPYTIYKHGGQGGSVVLDATGSYAGNNPNADLPNYDQNVISAYSWDFNGDNVFGDAAGATPTVTYAAMAGFGRGAVGTYPIELAITVDTDYGDMRDWDVASVIVAEAPPGDANFDGDVDGADYTIWADHYQQGGAGWAGGDFNEDGTVDGADYTIWADNYVAGAAAPVPEPAVLSLLILGGPALVRRRKKKKESGGSSRRPVTAP